MKSIRLILFSGIALLAATFTRAASSTADIEDSIDSNFPSNTEGAITALKLRTVTKSMTGSAYNRVDDAALATFNTNGSSYYLNAANFNNGTLSALRLPAFSGGDATSSAGSAVLTLATVNGNVGSFGSATQSLTITADGKGRITAVSAQTVTPALGSITGLGSNVAAFLAAPTAANFDTMTGASATLDVIGSTRGSFLYRGASGWSARTPGTSGLALLSGGAGADPNYGTLGNAGLQNSAVTIAGNSVSLGGSLSLDTITGLSTTGIIKRTGANTLAIATSGTDYAPATSGSSILYGDGAGGFSSATVGTGLSFSGGSLTNSGVRTLTGTANQISVDTSTGAVTLSLPTTLSIPGTLTTAGGIEVVLNSSASTAWFAGNHITGANATNTAYQVDSWAAQARFDFRRANGTKGSETTLVAADTIGGIGARGYNGAAYTGTAASILAKATETWTNTTGTSTAIGSTWEFAYTPEATATSITGLTLGNGRATSIGATSSWANWGQAGVALNFPAATYTNRTSSGTITGLDMISIQAPTFAASSATTGTDNATLRIAGAPVAGSNFTGTNMWALYVYAGDSKFAGKIKVTDSTAATNTTSGALQVTGGGSLGGALWVGGTINGRSAPRITSISSSATPTINTDNCDVVTITALATAITSMTTNLTGTPTNCDQLEVRILDNGTARAITWGASWASGTATLPTTTTVNKALSVYFEWDSVQSKWMCQSTGSYP